MIVLPTYMLFGWERRLLTQKLVLLGMAFGLALPLVAQDQPDVEAYLVEQNAALPAGLEICKSYKDPRPLLSCIYHQSYPIPKRREPDWQLSVIRVAVALLDFFHAEPVKDSQYFTFVIQISTEEQGIPYGSCGAADDAVDRLWDRWKGSGRKTLTNLQGTDFHTAFRIYLSSGCCARSAVCPLLRAYNLDVPPDVVNQYQSADQRAQDSAAQPAKSNTHNGPISLLIEERLGVLHALQRTGPLDHNSSFYFQTKRGYAPSERF